MSKQKHDYNDVTESQRKLREARIGELLNHIDDITDGMTRAERKEFADEAPLEEALAEALVSDFDADELEALDAARDYVRRRGW